MTKAAIKETEDKMKATVEATRHELGSLRAGKASLAILEPVKADYYGSKVPLNQVATLSVPEPRLIVLQPWDPKQISIIERAISLPNTAPPRCLSIACRTAGRNIASSTPSTGKAPSPAAFSSASSARTRSSVSGVIRRSNTATMSLRFVPK